VTVLQKILSCS